MTLNAFAVGIQDPETNAAASEFIRSKIREIVQDPEVAARLSRTGTRTFLDASVSTKSARSATFPPPPLGSRPRS